MLLSEATRKSLGKRRADGKSRAEPWDGRRQGFKGRLVPNVAF